LIYDFKAIRGVYSPGEDIVDSQLYHIIFSHRSNLQRSYPKKGYGSQEPRELYPSSSDMAGIVMRSDRDSRGDVHAVQADDSFAYCCDAGYLRLSIFALLGFEPHLPRKLSLLIPPRTYINPGDDGGKLHLENNRHTTPKTAPPMITHNIASP